MEKNSASSDEYCPNLSIWHVVPISEVSCPLFRNTSIWGQFSEARYYSLDSQISQISSKTPSCFRSGSCRRITYKHR